MSDFFKWNASKQSSRSLNSLAKSVATMLVAWWRSSNRNRLRRLVGMRSSPKAYFLLRVRLHNARLCARNASGEPGAVERMVFVGAAGFVPIAFVDRDHFAGMAGDAAVREEIRRVGEDEVDGRFGDLREEFNRKSTRLNSSHRCISYAVFCLKK